MSENNTQTPTDLESQKDQESSIKPKERKVVVPGEIIVSGEDYLPGDGARRSGEHIRASKFGLTEEQGRVIKVIQISGAYVPRRGNSIIGRVTDINFSGWSIDIDTPMSAFLPIEEFPKFVNKSEMDQHLAVGDVISAKIWSIKGRGIDLAMKGRGLGKLESGFTFKVISSRVPRIIGREGSMINLIKDKTDCNITVGQNGWIWIRGQDIESEKKARRAIEYITENIHISGLTEKMEGWFDKN
jgi:exosome complex component RRP4